MTEGVGYEQNINLMETHYTGAVDVIYAVSTYGYTSDSDRWFRPNSTMELMIYKIQTGSA